jgi:formate hydrogenlyase subunit 4
MIPAYYLSAAQMLLFISISPGVLGLLRLVKARLQGRRGPRLYQPYLDLWKLFHKRPVIPEVSSWVFVAAPLIVFACYCFIGVITPLLYLPGWNEVFDGLSGPPLADLLVIVYLLGFTHFVLALAGMDSGSPFGGMGGGREMFLNVISEPALILSVYALAISAHTTSLPGIMRFCADLGLKEFINNPSFWLVFLSLCMVMLAEAGRIPFDNPATHLELTMIGKAISLEYSGPFLALLEWAEAMRLTFFLTLILNLLVPFSMLSQGQHPALGILLVGLFILRLVVLVVLLAVWELTRVKLRLRALINPGGLALAFSTLAIFVAVAINYFI